MVIAGEAADGPAAVEGIARMRPDLPSLDAKIFRTALTRVAGRNGFCTKTRPAPALGFPETRMTGTAGNEFLTAWAKLNPSMLGASLMARSWCRSDP